MDIKGPASQVHPIVVYGPKATGSKFIARFSNLKCAAASVTFHGRYYWCQNDKTKEEFTFEECSRLLLVTSHNPDVYQGEAY